MKRYTRDNLADVEPGWYWAKRYADDTPAVVPVYWRTWQSHDEKRRLIVDFGYRSEMNFCPDATEWSDDFDAGFVLLGPIPVPADL